MKGFLYSNDIDCWSDNVVHSYHGCNTISFHSFCNSLWNYSLMGLSPDAWSKNWFFSRMRSVNWRRNVWRVFCTILTWSVGPIMWPILLVVIIPNFSTIFAILCGIMLWWVHFLVLGLKIGVVAFLDLSIGDGIYDKICYYNIWHWMLVFWWEAVFSLVLA